LQILLANGPNNPHTGIVRGNLTSAAAAARYIDNHVIDNPVGSNVRAFHEWYVLNTETGKKYFAGDVLNTEYGFVE
jgi:hypothetical protein